MHLTSRDEPITFDWINEKYSAEDFNRCPTPFDMVYLFENTNNSNIRYPSIEDVIDAVAMALFVDSSLAGHRFRRIYDSVYKVISEGCLNVKNKQAWVAGVGASRIVFRGEEVADFYAKKVMLRLIQLLNSNVKDASSLALDWIDEIRIRKDDVLDFLHEKKIYRIWSSDIVDEKSPEVEVTQYCDSRLHLIREHVFHNFRELKEGVSGNLVSTVADLLKSGEGCVTTTADFLSSVKKQLSVGLQEMQDERKVFEDQSAGLLQERDIFLKDLEREANKIFLVRSGKKMAAYKEHLCVATNNYLLNELEIIRRTYAIELFNHLMQSIDGYANQTDKLKTSLRALSEHLEQSIREKLETLSTSSPMEIDLTVNAIRSLKVQDETIDVNKFYSVLGDQKLDDLNDIDKLEAAMLAFAQSQDEYEQWKNKMVQQAVNDLSEEAFHEVYRRAFEMADPLLQIDNKGYFTRNGFLPECAAMDVCFLCVNEINNSRFLDCCLGRDVCRSIQFVTSSFKDRIVFLRQKYVFPAYAVSGIDYWRRDYNSSKISCHFDENIHQRMIQEGYDIMPADEDDSGLN